MKEYFKGIIGSIFIIGIGIVCLVLSIIVGPKKSYDFFEGFLRGAGYVYEGNRISFLKI